MEPFYDHKRYSILYVDDEAQSLKYFQRAFGESFDIYTASSADEGLDVLKKHGDNVGILVTDQRMPGVTGTQLLEKVRQMQPRIVRILATAYSDLEAAIEAVNTGAIYKYVTKPWDIPELEITLKRAMEFFIVQTERDGLMREKLSVLHNMMITDRVISLGVVAAGLGHYVRNSLVAVRTFLDLAPNKLEEENLNLERLRNPNYWNEFYHKVQEQVKRISELLGELGEATRPADGAFGDEASVGEVVAGALERLSGKARDKGMTITSRIPDSLPRLQVDRHKFDRLFELLLAEEIRHLPEGGSVILDAEETTGETGPKIRITVTDSGAGLSDEDLRSVFDPFYVRDGDPGEFGINLMACYFIVHHHGGSINVEGIPAGGTRFVLIFPTKQSSAAPLEEGTDFVSKVLTNEVLWERLLAGV